MATPTAHERRATAWQLGSLLLVGRSSSGSKQRRPALVRGGEWPRAGP